MWLRFCGNAVLAMPACEDMDARLAHENTMLATHVLKHMDASLANENTVLAMPAFDNMPCECKHSACDARL